MPPIVDIHTHVYPPYYISLLRSRSTIPFIRSSPVGDRLIILPDEASSTSLSAGRPIGPEYYDISEKIAFMDKHSIGVSVISLANPWLDWVPSEEAAERARAVNDELNEMCGTYRGRLYAFGTLPVSGSVKDVVEELRRLKGLEYIRGVILGTGGKGKGLDDAEMGEVWKVIEETGTVVFVHPHYGLPGEVYGPRAGEYGHVLPLALGFVSNPLFQTRLPTNLNQASRNHPLDLPPLPRSHLRQLPEPPTPSCSFRRCPSLPRRPHPFLHPS